MTITIYLDTKPDTDGRQQIFFDVKGQNKRSRFSSGIKVHKDNFNGSTISKKEINADLKNALLQAKYSTLTNIIAEANLKGIELLPSQVKESYTKRTKEKEPKKPVTGKHSLVEYFDRYKDLYSKVYKSNTIRADKQVKDHIIKFDPDIAIEDINQNWLVRYCSYLVDLELEDSTIKERHLKSIRNICKEARREGITVSSQLDKFTWKSQPKQPFFATWDEVEEIEKIKDFVLPIQERIRDIFLLSCYTGLRDSDLKEIRKENLFKQGKQTMLKIRVTKTNFDYAIPLSAKVEEIFKKHRYDIRTVSQQEYNREIKHIARVKVKGDVIKVRNSGNKRITETVPRHEMFTTHTGRRTFGRRFLDKGGSLVVLSKIYGHKNLETTLKYIGYQPQEIVEEFNKVFG
jgi:integrase